MKVEETVTMLPMEEILKSVEQYVKDGKIGFFTEQNDTGETESTTIPVTKICLEYYIDETADGITYRPVWSFSLPLPVERFPGRTGTVLHRRGNGGTDS